MSLNKYIIPSVGVATLYSAVTKKQIVNGNTLTDSTVEFSASEKEIRGGFLGGLLGKIFTSPQLNVTITDALFSLEYLALSCGGDIIQGGDALTVKSFTVKETNQIDVSPAVPQEFLGKKGYGEYTIAGEDNWRPIQFSGSKASVSDLSIGTKICVRFVEKKNAMREFTVSSAFVPSECYLVLTLPLFKARQDKVYSDSSKVGEIQIHIPRFQLNGTQTLSLTMDGASTTSLSGSAMVDLSTVDMNCENTSGIYAKFKEIIYERGQFDDVINIVVADSDVELKAKESQELEVYAFYGANTLPSKISNSDLTFAVKLKDASIASVGEHTGIVTATTTGVATIDIAITEKPEIKATATVNVITE